MLARSPLRTALFGILIVAACGFALLAIGVLPRATRARAQAAIGDCGDSSAPYAQVLIDTAPRIDLELARTSQEQEYGLMYRQYLPPDSGMLFMFGFQTRENFWMLHTLIPLSIAFIDQDGTIVDIQDMPVINDPSDPEEAMQKSTTPAAPYWYALEVNEGWFFQNGVGVGQQMVFCLGGS